MAVYVKNLWPGPIPYVADDAFAREWINHFNHKVGISIFVPHNGEADYVEFEKSDGRSMCKRGRKGGKQVIGYKDRKESILHEMGHCVGLGHEQYHPDWPLRATLVAKGDQNLHAYAYLTNMDQYTQFGFYDPDSIMVYTLENLGITRGDLQAAGMGTQYPARNTDLSDGDLDVIRYLHWLVQ